MAASYRDRRGAVHRRRVALHDNALMVSDDVSGFSTRAVLRWRVRPGDWRLAGNMLSDGRHTLTVSANVPIVRIEIQRGWESRFYLRRTELPVLEVELEHAGEVMSEYRWRG